MKVLIGGVLLFVAQMGAAQAQELVVTPGTAVEATVEGAPAKLIVDSGRLDRLTLDWAFVARHGIKPAPIMGKAEMSFAGRQELRGHNRPLDFTVAGMAQKGRAFWFESAPIGAADGRIGPWALPQPRVTFRLREDRPGDTLVQAPLFGGIDGSSMTGYNAQGVSMGITFDVESGEDYPIASAAAGAAIAKAHGGTLSGPSWDVELMLGVRRPVRLMTLERPLVMPPFRFTKIAVRVRDRVDAGGRGETIAEAGEVEDPAEIVVQARKKGPKPLMAFTIPRKALEPCARITFDKAARKIELSCTVTPGL